MFHLAIMSHIYRQINLNSLYSHRGCLFVKNSKYDGNRRIHHRASLPKLRALLYSGAYRGRASPKWGERKSTVHTMDIRAGLEGLGWKRDRVGWTV